MNKILNSIKFVVDNSKDVSVDMENIRRFANKIAKDYSKNKPKAWFEEGDLSLNHLPTQELLLFLAIFHVSSFCYWGKSMWGHDYNGKRYERSYGLISALLDESKKNKNFLSAEYLSRLPYSEWKRIMADKGKLLFMKERWRFIRNLGSVLTKRYKGSIINLVYSSKGDANKLIVELSNNFEAFKDTSIYNGKEIFFLKKAQVLVGDIFYVSKIKKLELIKNVEELTACTDYRLPQVLRYFKVINYSQKLSNQVDLEIEIPKNSVEEIEIRANTIWASHLVGEILRRDNPDITDLEVNNYIWLLSQKMSKSMLPHHRIRTTCY